MIELINNQKFEVLNYITGKYGKFTLTKEQEDLINFVLDNDKTLIKKCRQQGASVALESLFTTMLMTQENVKICIFLSDTNRGTYTLGNIKSFILKSKNKVVVEKVTNRKIKLANGNYIKIINSVYDISFLKDDDILFWLDEISFSKTIKDVYDAIIARDKKQKITITSGSNGIDNTFLPLYILGENSGYKTMTMHWLKSMLSDSKAEFITAMSKKEYDKYFSGKFIIKEESINNETKQKIVEQINKYNKNEQLYTISDFDEFLHSDNVILVNDNTYQNPGDGYIDYKYKLGINR